MHEVANQPRQQKPVPAVRRVERQRRALRPVDSQRLADDGVGLCQRHFAALAPHSGGKVGDSNGAVKAMKLDDRSEEHTSELQSLMRISYAVFCLKKNKKLIKSTPP